MRSVSPADRPGWHREAARAFVRDFGITTAVVFVYFVLRGAVPARVDDAVALSLRLIDIEKAVGIFREADLQEVSIRSEAVRQAANFIYAFLHFPALVGAGVWTWTCDRRRFLQVRNTLFVSMVIGLAFYYAVPAAPPRLMADHGHDIGITDTIFGGSGAETYPQWAIFRNDYAAIPSFHFGWMVLASAAFWLSSRHIVARVGAVLLLVVMAWASAVTGNHFFIDMVLGGIVVGAAWVVAAKLRRWRPLVRRR